MLQFEEARTSEDTSHHLVTPQSFGFSAFLTKALAWGHCQVPAVKVRQQAGLIATPPWSGRAEA
jgi:hypothetical protein